MFGIDRLIGGVVSPVSYRKKGKNVANTGNLADIPEPSS